MTAQRADTHTHSRALRIGVHNLPCLVVHLHLFLRVAIGLEHVDLRNHVVGQLMGELLDGLHLARLYNLLVLLLQFGHSGGTGTRGTLIGGHVDALDVTQVLQRLENDHHHDSGAVGVGNDTARAVQGIHGITFGHHQGHVVVHAEGTRIVDHHAAILRNGLGKLLRRTGTSTGKGDVDVLEIVVMLQQLHFDFLATKSVLTTSRTLRAKEHQFVHRKISLIEQAQEFLSHSTARTYDCNFHFVLFLIFYLTFCVQR